MIQTPRGIEVVDPTLQALASLESRDVATLARRASVEETVPIHASFTAWRKRFTGVSPGGGGGGRRGKGGSHHVWLPAHAVREEVQAAGDDVHLHALPHIGGWDAEGEEGLGGGVGGGGGGGWLESVDEVKVMGGMGGEVVGGDGGVGGIESIDGLDADGVGEGDGGSPKVIRLAYDSPLAAFHKAAAAAAREGGGSVAPRDGGSVAGREGRGVGSPSRMSPQKMEFLSGRVSPIPKSPEDGGGAMESMEKSMERVEERVESGWKGQPMQLEELRQAVSSRLSSSRPLSSSSSNKGCKGGCEGCAGKVRALENRLAQMEREMASFAGIRNEIDELHELVVDVVSKFTRETRALEDVVAPLLAKSPTRTLPSGAGSEEGLDRKVLSLSRRMDGLDKEQGQSVSSLTARVQAAEANATAAVHASSTALSEIAHLRESSAAQAAQAQSSPEGKRAKPVSLGDAKRVAAQIARDQLDAFKLDLAPVIDQLEMLSHQALQTSERSARRSPSPAAARHTQSQLESMTATLGHLQADVSVLKTGMRQLADLQLLLAEESATLDPEPSVTDTPSE